MDTYRYNYREGFLGADSFPPTVKETYLKFNILAGSLFVTKRAEIITKQAELVK